MTKKYWKKNFSFLIILFIFILGACSNTKTENQTQADKLTIVTTFYPMYEFTKQVVGDEANVELLIDAGTEPHDYEPSAKDIAKISDVDVFVYNSDEFETWVKDIVDNLKKQDVTVVDASQSIDLMAGQSHHDEDEEEQDHDHDHEHELDPHVWLDPVLAKKEVETICNALTKKYPDKQEVFEKNTQHYTKELDTLNQEYVDAFAQAKNKIFVTQHAAFGYLAKQYGLTQEAISGISPDQEPSPSRMAELKKYIEEHDVSVIYFESSASSKVAKTLAKETGVELAVLNPLESLTKQEQEDGENYLTVMRQNLSALKKSIN